MHVTLLDLARPVEWTPWWAAVAFLVGMSVGGFVLALPGRAFGMPRWQRVSRLGLLVALAAGIAAPPCMLAALARPDRVGLLYARAEGSSSWLATCATLMPAYLAALAVFAWTTLRRDLAAAEGRGVLAWLQRAASLGGGGAPRLRMLAMFTAGGLGFVLMLGVAAELRPAWESALLPWHLAVTALAGALGAVLVLDRLAGGLRDAATMALFARGAAGLLVLGMMLGREPWHPSPPSSPKGLPPCWRWRGRRGWAGWWGCWPSPYAGRSAGIWWRRRGACRRRSARRDCCSCCWWGSPPWRRSWDRAGWRRAREKPGGGGCCWLARPGPGWPP